MIIFGRFFTRCQLTTHSIGVDEKISLFSDEFILLASFRSCWAFWWKPFIRYSKNCIRIRWQFIAKGKQIIRTCKIKNFMIGLYYLLSSSLRCAHLLRAWKYYIMYAGIFLRQFDYTWLMTCTSVIFFRFRLRNDGRQWSIWSSKYWNVNYLSSNGNESWHFTCFVDKNM